MCNMECQAPLIISEAYGKCHLGHVPSGINGTRWYTTTWLSRSNFFISLFPEPLSSDFHAVPPGEFDALPGYLGFLWIHGLLSRNLS